MGQPYYFGTCVSGNFGFGNLYCFTVMLIVSMPGIVLGEKETQTYLVQDLFPGEASSRSQLTRGR